MSAQPNSFHCYVVDEIGDTCLHVFGTNREDLVESSKRHARWWIGWCKRPGSWRDTDSLGNPVRSPVGRARVMIEFYHDKTAVDAR